MKTEVESLHVLTMDDFERSVEVLAKAFQTDPLWQWLVPDEAKRARYLPNFYRAFVRAGIRSEQVYGAGNPVEGVATWSKPGQEVSFGGLIGVDFLKLIFSPFIVAFARTAFPIFSRFEVMQRQYAPEPHFYLNNIGVLPEAQGKGLASKLIRPFLNEAEAQGVGVYTETMTPSNVGLYEHYGFRVMEQYRVPKTDLSIWAFYLPPPR
jgi:ribosomal protein S18 acetylase RimI-like enzyme